MYLDVKLITVGELEKSSYTRADGSQGVLKKRTFFLEDPSNTIAGEMLGDAAEDWPWFSHRCELWKVNFVVKSRKARMSDGTEKYFTSIKILSLEPWK